MEEGIESGKEERRRVGKGRVRGRKGKGNQSCSKDLDQRNTDVYASPSVPAAAIITPQQTQAEVQQDQTPATASLRNGSVISVATLFITGKYVQQVWTWVAHVKKKEHIAKVCRFKL